MSEDPQNPERPEGDIFELLASLFGGDRESMERALSQSGINPAELQAMSEQMPAIPPGLEHMFSTLAGGSTSQGPANWELAHNIARQRSEEHTSELQSRGHLVCRLLLAKTT